MRRKSENKRMFLLLRKAKLRENGPQRLCLVSKGNVSAMMRRDSPNHTTMSINTTHRPSQPLRHLIGSLSSTELFGFQRTIIRGLLGCHSVLFTDCLGRHLIIRRYDEVKLPLVCISLIFVLIHGRAYSC